MAYYYSYRELKARAAKLRDLYALDDGTVAYVDETFSLDGPGSRFYAVTASLIAREHCDETRDSLLAAYDGEPMHASQMWSDGQKVSLELAIKTVASQPVKSCIVVQTAVADDDEFGDRARSSCMANLVRTLSNKYGVTLYVADSRGKPDADRIDTDLLHTMRSEPVIPRGVAMVHRMPSEEPLIGLADVASWAFRQNFVGTRNRDMFEPLRAMVSVRQLRT